MELDPATAAYKEHGYNALPVEAWLGPHRFLVPANYFRDQIGPDFQGGWSLMVQWPDLEPLPPGKRSGQNFETFEKTITISPRYVDRVPIETRLEASTIPVAPAGSPSLQDPSRRLDLMLAQPERDGLTPYIVDQQALDAFADAEAARLGMNRRRTGRSTYKDWFIRRDSSGQLQTLIRCDHHESEPGTESNPQCDHDLVIPDLKVAVSISYHRDYLPEWELIEHRARELIERFRSTN